MKMRVLAIVLAGIISIPMQSLPVMASGIGVGEGDKVIVEVLEETNEIREMQLETEIKETIEPQKETETVTEILKPELDKTVETEIEPESIEVQKPESEVSLVIEDNEIQTAADDFEVVSGVLVRYTGIEENVVIPSNLGITTIGNNAFYSKYNLKSVTIPLGVTTIQNGAFKYCDYLISVSLPNSLKTIGSEAFYSNRKLTTINFPSNLETIGNEAFYNCDSLISVTIPNKVTLLGNKVFYGCDSLTSVTLSNKLTSVGEYLFYDCSNLERVIIPDSVTSIGKYAFYNCDGLTNIELPNSITIIGDYVFQSCGSLKSIKLPSALNTIGRYAFADCIQIKTLNIPGSVLNLKNYAFSGCSGLASVTIGNGVHTIGQGAFVQCTSLSTVVLPNSLAEVEYDAFSGCSNLASITIPSNVIKLAGRAFADCITLKTVKFLGSAPEVNSYYSNTFSGTPSDLTIYYLSGKTGFTNPWCGKTTKVFIDTDKINDFVKRLYEKVLGRTAAASEISYYSKLLVGQTLSGADAGKNFVFSPEFKNKKLSNIKFVEVLYQTFMGRGSDASGKAYWVSMLDNNVSREFVFKGFVESTEYTNICKSYGITRGNITLTESRDQNANLTMFVSRCYQKALGRTPEVEGLNYYAAEIQAKRVTPVQAAQNFVFSPEFKNKSLSNTDYIKVLYRTFMGREYDQSGLNYHLNRMKNGTGREEILLGFANSPEFKTIMSGFGL